jgi:hypothetical protein
VLNSLVKPLHEPATHPAVDEAQRLSSKAYVEMLVIEQSMERVNSSLAAARKTHARNPRILRKLLALIRQEARVQESAEREIRNSISGLSDAWECLENETSVPNLGEVKESIALRIADLDYSLKSRAGAMSAARMAPFHWLRALKDRRGDQQIAKVRVLDWLWKIDVAAAVLALFLPLDLDSPMGFSNMMLSGLLFALAAWTSTVHWKKARLVARSSCSHPLPRAR